MCNNTQVVDLVGREGSVINGATPSDFMVGDQGLQINGRGVFQESTFQKRTYTIRHRKVVEAIIKPDLYLNFFISNCVMSLGK